ncbi:hypothetical protein ACVLD2_004068 [Paenibacillus sp. PvR052]|nr:hypothetical protein [Paenibacillus sp. PvP091]MBP1170620.1 hypothetical protein [Paenibacillus sp. PvR098]MBP2441648.1 hypothetical protein [Paenibacillus sp. PvP052]
MNVALSLRMILRMENNMCLQNESEYDRVFNRDSKTKQLNSFQPKGFVPQIGIKKQLQTSIELW